MNKRIEERVREEAAFALSTNMTIREISKHFKVSKSTTHKDLKERLLEIDATMYNKVKDIFEDHIKVRHIRGGQSTKLKYLNMKK
ncbi:MAG: stage III sporulation protein D [Bacilli bacterium]|nr:stage III sporulation protein D [Bacilli bacterium]